MSGATVADLGAIRCDFAGAGGMVVGIRQAGFTGRVVACEFNPAAAATARAAGHEVREGDVRDIPFGTFGPLLGYTAGPPCQTFSPAGKGEGRKAFAVLLEAANLVAFGGLTPAEAVEAVAGADHGLDERSVLVLHPLHVIVNERPGFVVLEQVKTVKPLWEIYCDLLDRLGYEAEVDVWSSEQYGAPQTRQRASLTAIRRDLLDDLNVILRAPATHSRYYPRTPEHLDSGVLPWISFADAVGRGLTARPAHTVMGGGTATGGAEPFGNGARKQMVKAIDAGDWQWEPDTTDCVPGDTSWVERRPSPTMVGSFRPDIVAAPGYRKPGDPPRQKTPGSVRVNVREAAALQTFPADYPWQGNKGQQHQQVGNAIPPIVAQNVVGHLLSIIEKGL